MCASTYENTLSETRKDKTGQDMTRVEIGFMWETPNSRNNRKRSGYESPDCESFGRLSPAVWNFPDSCSDD